MGEVVLGAEGGYGYESRSLFAAQPGWDQVGIDLSGLELRCLAHYLAPYDDGAYADTVVNGDVHTLNQQAAGLRTRAAAKTFVYALLYGAGDLKLGTTAMEDVGASGWTERKLRTEGKKLKTALLTNIPALGILVSKVKAKGAGGKLVGLDGRTLYVRSAHAALNTLLQAAGAIIAKRWMVGTHQHLRTDGLILGQDFNQVAFVHDELQFECRKGLWIDKEKGEHRVGEAAKRAVKETGSVLNLRCQLDCEYKVGHNWAQTH